jgi:hypothetical protein
MDELRRTRTPNLVVAVGFDLGLEGGVQEVVAAVDTFVPTGFELSTLRDDIGLIRLAQPITSVLPMPVRGDAPSPCEVGADLRYVGWGTVADDELDTSVKRTVDIPLHHYDDARVFGYDPTGERNVCAGDSGGAVLSILPDGEVALVAVNSYVADDDDTPCAGGYTAGTRVDRQLPWIEGYVDLEVGTTAVSCEAATDVPSTCGGGGPSTLVLTLGGLAFAWRRTILAGRRTTAQPRIRR